MPAIEIDDYAFYAERLEYTEGRTSKTRVYTGRAVRERMDAMVYTDSGENRMYKTAVQSPAGGVITATTMTSPDKRNHHTATWTPITEEEVDRIRQARAAAWEQVWKVAASAGLIWDH